MTIIFLVTTEWAAPGMVPVHEKGREFPEGFEAHITLIGRGQLARTPRSVACCATQRNRNVLLRKGPQCVMQRPSSSLNLSDTLPLVPLVMADVWHSRGCLGRCRRQPSVSHPSAIRQAWHRQFLWRVPLKQPCALCPQPSLKVGCEYRQIGAAQQRVLDVCGDV